tara:strand:+ start:417 stop:584 length:168 start_codon:yes stop_codon:yes gene_type:complete
MLQKLEEIAEKVEKNFLRYSRQGGKMLAKSWKSATYNFFNQRDFFGFLLFHYQST